ncbi:transcription elongation factor B polypeptide 3 isoform X2 [Diabrotica virgifera virgifera]|uniref:TFIIS N-terminal domain-containing protein n=1 Tax=Diabrotica virgifera virgifera TaxID=50390 RepID=A0ABM5JJ16_DIAVI|nr:transcription elongation factor B polypeptide 3 isoform X2 [Diabrotica virgifera virgifera]
MTSSNDDVIKAILQYQERLERYKTSKSEDKIQYVLGKLGKLPIRTSHLETTGVGRTVNALKKFGGEVGEIAKDLVISWKEMVLEEEKAAQETSMETEEDADSNYSSENENKDCKKDISKETVSGTSDGNESEGYDSKREVPNRSDTEKKSNNEKPRNNGSRDSSSESSEEEEKHSKYDKHSSSKRRYSSESSSDRHSTKKSNSNKETRKKRDSSESDSGDRHRSKKSSKDTKKRRHSSESSSDDRHSSKKSRRDTSPKSSHKHKSSKDEHKSSKDEKERSDKKDKHSSSKHRESSEKHKSSSEKHKDSSEKSESKKDSEEEKKHRSKKEHEDTHSSNKSEKHKKPEERENSHSNAKYEKSKKHEEKSDKHSQSSHSSKHRDKESPHSSSDKKHSKEKDKREKEKSESKKERKEEKKPKEIIAEQKKSEHKSKESSSSSKHDSSEKKNKIKKEKEVVKKVQQQKIIHGIDSESGASFAEALGMCGPYVSSPKKKPIVEKKKESSSVDKYVDSDEYEPVPVSKPKTMTKYDDGASSSSSKVVVPSLMKEPEPLTISLSSLLPEISPNYKPLCVPFDNQPKRIISDDEALSRVMMNKNQRTKVYSGNKTIGKVESLFQICVRILQDNIDALEYTGGVPYLILKPIMERATPDQLFNLEHHNPYLIEDTDGLWKLHCQKDFRTKRREEMESWRDMYMRCLDEREAKLNAVTATIKQSQTVAIPVRTTKLAYVESEYVKPPRNVARKQRRKRKFKLGCCIWKNERRV